MVLVRLKQNQDIHIINVGPELQALFDLLRIHLIFDTVEPVQEEPSLKDKENVLIRNILIWIIVLEMIGFSTLWYFQYLGYIGL